MSSDVVSVETFAAGLNNRVLACRELHHLWVPWTVEVIHAGSGRHRSLRVGGYVRTMKCRQCTTLRRQILDSHGGIVSNSYRYADGYLASNVESGVSRDVFRLEALTRFIEQNANAGTVIHTDADGAPASLRAVS